MLFHGLSSRNSSPMKSIGIPGAVSSNRWPLGSDCARTMCGHGMRGGRSHSPDGEDISCSRERQCSIVVPGSFRDAARKDRVKLSNLIENREGEPCV